MKTIEEIMGLVEKFGDACETFGDYQVHANALNCVKAKSAIESALRELVECDAKKVKVDKGALQMVLNALDRDSDAGMVSRKEMRDELIASIE